jgi:hypothetical protein
MGGSHSSRDVSIDGVHLQGVVVGVCLCDQQSSLEFKAATLSSTR